jgi:hypothetical protein
MPKELSKNLFLRAVVHAKSTLSPPILPTKWCLISEMPVYERDDDE